MEAGLTFTVTSSVLESRVSQPSLVSSSSLASACLSRCQSALSEDTFPISHSTSKSYARYVVHRRMTFSSSRRGWGYVA